MTERRKSRIDRGAAGVRGGLEIGMPSCAEVGVAGVVATQVTGEASGMGEPSGASGRVVLQGACRIGD